MAIAAPCSFLSRLARHALLAITALGAATSAHAQPRFDFDRTPGVLAKDVVPEHYALALDLDPARDTFLGTVTITLRVRRAVDVIELHAHQLEAEDARLAVPGQPARGLRVQPDAERQTWRLALPEGDGVPAGTAEVTLRYRGNVQASGQGLFAAPYGSAAARGRMLATQLASIHARNLLPAFDEPVFRAAFSVTVRTPPDVEALSNMPRAERREDNGAIVHRFATTPPMPSYLLALAVGRFDVLEGQAAGVPLRILTAPGKREQARYAMAVTERALPWFVDYFGVPYALPKLDQLAVPGTRLGAMEDWGLISYEEPVLLFDPATSSPSRQPAIHETVAHELAHMWFGNLVTHASWEEIWLNEAFATWIAGKVTAAFNPQWQVDAQRRLALEAVMARDAGNATRPIRSGPVSERAVYDVLDSVTYQKGGAVLEMLEQWIGADRFRAGLRTYMQERRLSNATAGDLWHHVGAAAGRDLAGVAGSWTDQPGLPLVAVQAQCRAGRTALTLTQQRFRTDPALARDGLWQVPVSVELAGRRHGVLLAQSQSTTTLDGCGPVVVNAGGAGYYRVDYAPALRRALDARFATLAPLDRVTLLSDRLALVQAGRVPAADYFALLARVPQVTDASRASLVRQAIDGIAFLDTALAGTPAQAAARTAARSLLNRELARVGWDARTGEDLETPRLRAALIERLARLDDPTVLARAEALYRAAATGGPPLPPGLRATVTRVAGIRADAARFAQLRAGLLAATGEEERWMYAQALASVRDPQLADAVLQLALDPAVPANVATELPALLAERSPHLERAYAFTVAHWPALARRAGSYFNADAWLLPSVAMHGNDAALAERVRADAARTDVATRMPAERAATQIRLHAAVRDREATRLARALGSWQPGPVATRH